jgi:hypothetical protein
MKTPTPRSTVPSTTGIILYTCIVTHSLLSSLQKNFIKYERWQNVCFPREKIGVKVSEKYQLCELPETFYKRLFLHKI